MTAKITESIQKKKKKAKPGNIGCSPRYSEGRDRRIPKFKVYLDQQASRVNLLRACLKRKTRIGLDMNLEVEFLP